MKLVAIIIILFIATSCNNEKKRIVQSEAFLPEKIIDTIVAKKQNVFLDSSWVDDFYSKSYFYYCIIGKDTMRFALKCNEDKSDSLLNLSFYQNEGVLFTSFLSFAEKCIPKMEEDFNTNRLNTIYFNSPIYYPDLSIRLSKEYQHNFGTKSVGYKKLNDFLLHSSLTVKLNSFLKPLRKKAKSYSIEKFYLTEKKNINYYLPNIDIKDYPDFVIDCGGVTVQLENF